MEVIERLKLRPREPELHAILCLLASADRLLAFELAKTSALLQFTVPEVYSSCSDTIRLKIIELLQCPSGVGGLINTLLLVGEEEPSRRQLYGKVLLDLFDEALVKNVLQDAKPLQVGTINKMLFKGKAFETFNMSDYGIESRVLHSSEAYVSYLCTQLIDFVSDSKIFNECFLSLLSFNLSCIYVIFDILFSREKWQLFMNHYKSIKLFERKRVLLQFLHNYTPKRFLSDEMASQNIQPLHSILRQLVPGELINLAMVQNVISLQNTSLNSLVVLLAGAHSPSQINDIFQQLLEDWGNETVMKSELISVQESKTHFLIQMLFFKDQSFAYSLTTTSQFIECISNRLNSHSDKVKSLGVILADQVCSLANKDKIFLIPISNELLYLTLEKSYCQKSSTISTDEAWKLLHEPIVTAPEEATEVLKLQKKILAPARYKDSDDETTSDSDSDDGDDPSVQQRPRLPTPVYIEDLIKYLSVDKDHRQAYEMREKALAAGPTLIRQKGGFGSEVKLNASELMHVLVGLTNIFERPDFDSLRLNCLIAVLVSYPEGAKELVTILGSGDYSLQQRMCILSALSLAARELRGFKDEVVSLSFKEKQFPTKTLPPALHNKYTALEHIKRFNAVEDRVFKALQDDLMVDDSEAAKDKLAGGKILRMSRRLRQPTATGIVAKVKDYSKVISSNFYYPLISLWIEVGGIDVGHYSSVLTAHYIKTLSLILHSSYSTSNDTYDMMREFLLVSMTVLKTALVDQVQVIEAIVTGILLVCDISDEDRLVGEFPQIIVFLQTWLSGIWETIIDKSVKSLSAGLLLRLTNVLEKYQATMTDQLNNPFGVYSAYIVGKLDPQAPQPFDIALEVVAHQAAFFGSFDEIFLDEGLDKLDDIQEAHDERFLAYEIDSVIRDKPAIGSMECFLWSYVIRFDCGHNAVELEAGVVDGDTDFSHLVVVSLPSFDVQREENTITSIDPTDGLLELGKSPGI